MGGCASRRGNPLILWVQDGSRRAKVQHKLVGGRMHFHLELSHGLDQKDVQTVDSLLLWESSRAQDAFQAAFQLHSSMRPSHLCY